MIINRYETTKVDRIKRILMEKYIPTHLKMRYLEAKYLNKTKHEWSNLDKKKVPKCIQIETINRCNGECPFCPVNRYSDKRKFAKMSDNLFKKIVDELSDIKYEGMLALFSNNEPLLDKRLVEFSKYAREKLPSAYIYIFTNGTLIDLNIVKTLANYMNEIVIDNYNDELELNDNIKEIDEACKKDKGLDEIVRIHLRKINETLNSRGGQSPNYVKHPSRKAPCLLPFNQMIIRPDGKVSLCCNDALGTMTLGDVNEQNILDVWNSNEYQKIRSIVLNDIKKIDICKECDAFYEY